MNKENLQTAVVIGSGGGIGSALREKLVFSNKYNQVIGYSRSNDIELDITDEKQILNATKKLNKENDKINMLINSVGYLHDSDFFPEKRVSELNSDYLLKSYKINAIGHALIIKNFLPFMDHDNHSVLVCLSARVGSITDNYLGGWFSYRASKAALNQIVKTTSIELKRKKSKLIIVALHPGTVLTKLSKPFVTNKANYFTTKEAADNILKIIAQLKIEDSGSFIDYKGDKISY